METIEKPEVLTPRKIRAKRIVQAVLDQTKSYTEIGQELIPGAKYPKQSLYEALQSKPVQDELRVKLADEIELWNEETITKKITFLAENASNDGNKLKALELLAKIKAMLTEKREISTPGQFTKSEDFAKLPLNEMISVIEARLKLNSQGVNTSQEKPEKV